ncbi:MAG: CHAP domain-containing protein, partial [bacterium]
MEEPLGSNRGPRVDEYLGSVGIDPALGGQPWCAAFVYWCFARAAADASVDNPVVRSASVLGQWAGAGRRGLRRLTREEALADPQSILPGCVFVISTGRGRGHM